MESLDIKVTYKGIVYELIEVLDNDLALAVPKSDVSNEINFPMTPVVIPFKP